jgi:hypothetical protein
MCYVSWGNEFSESRRQRQRCGGLVRGSNFSWIGAPYLQRDALDFGRTLGSAHTAEASRNEAEARYSKAVLGALQDANSPLSRDGHQSEHVVTLQKVEAEALFRRRSHTDRSARHGARGENVVAGVGRVAKGPLVATEKARHRLARAARLPCGFDHSRSIP